MVFRRLILLFILSLFGVSLYSVEPIIADGSAMIEGYISKAKNDALNNAYESAVKTTIVNLYSEQIVKTNEFKLAKLYKKAASFITSSKVIYNKQNTDVDSMDVRVQVTVDTAAIKEYMAENGLSLSEDKISTILPLIVERTSQEGEGQYWWGDASKSGLVTKKSFSDIEKALSKYLAQYNFSLIDPYSNELSSNVPDSYRYMELKAPEIIKLGQVFHAGLVSTGYVWTSCKRKKELNQTSCDTNLSVQIISTDTGKVVAAKRAQETGQALTNDEAKTISRARACKTVSDSLVYQLNRKWDKRTASNYQVVFKGLKDYTKYLKIRDILTGRQIPGYTNVVERYQSKGSLVFEGEKRGSSQTIQNNIISKGFPDGKVRIIKADDTSIEIEIL
ncbi:MAG: hypothetical protein NTY22_04730 [Proteobacteria bacterium]|nr:hypothetical protein [Pseudomonadota bacterium]